MKKKDIKNLSWETLALWEKLAETDEEREFIKRIIKTKRFLHDMAIFELYYD